MKKLLLRSLCALCLCGMLLALLGACSQKMDDIYQGNTYHYTTTYGGTLSSSLSLEFSGSEVVVTLRHYLGKEESISAVAGYDIKEEIKTVDGKETTVSYIRFDFPESASIRITDGIYSWIGDGEWLTLDPRVTVVYINSKAFWRSDYSKVPE